MLKLAIIILNYRTPNLVEQCLESLESQIVENETKVIVIDNDSKDSSPEEISRCIKEHNWQSWCQLICSAKNTGFAGGNNLGIESIEAENYLLLNSDTIVQPNAITELSNMLERDSDIGILSAHLVGQNSERQTTKFRFHTPISEFISNANIGLISRILRRWEVPIFDNDQTPPQWVCFAAVVIRKSVFEKIGLLDDKYFLYYEDVDFCKRAVSNNIRLDVCSTATVIHLVSASSQIHSSGDKKLERRPAYFYKSRSRYYKKHFQGSFGFITANIYWSVGMMISILVQPLRPTKKQIRYKNDFSDIWLS